jgi:myo-inositol 2-dehydrogenase/D-chiro-inositol 1-dehydrogenase
VGREVHLPLLATRRDVRVVGLADPDPLAREAAAPLAPAATTCASTEELIARVNADALIVATPPPDHEPSAIAALEHGWHVLIEKPLALGAASAERIAVAWRRTGRVAMVGFNYRFNDQFRAVGTMFRRGDLGAITSFTVVFGTSSRARSSWAARCDAGGDVLDDLASHLFDLLRSVTGVEIVSVAARLTDHGPGSPPHRADLALTLAGGVPITMVVEQDARDIATLEIVGSRGAVAVDRYRFWQPVRRPLGETRGVDVMIGRLRGASYGARKLRAPWGEPSHATLLDAFLAAIRGGADAPNVDDGARVVHLVAAARESARLGASVEVAAG